MRGLIGRILVLICLISPSLGLAAIASYAGTYTGTYTGPAGGTWAITISQTGAITGTIDDTNQASGLASADGSLTFASTGLDASFAGTINLSTGAVAGTWVLNRLGASGTFSGKAPYMGLWNNPNEAGWGISITQHSSSIVFAAAYTYDANGRPIWYVLPNCPVVASGSCTSTLYRVSGATPPTVPWNGAGKVVGTAGSGTLNFTDVDHGTFTFTIDGVGGVKTIQKQLFSNGTHQARIDYTDLWWNANESGWGVAVTQDHGIIFATWFAYDGVGNAMWYVASNCTLVGSGCTGDLYQVTGGSPLTSAWNGANQVVTKVGTIAIAFAGANAGTMNYSINGVSASRDITRQPF